jgi:hypothetical protein
MATLPLEISWLLLPASRSSAKTVNFLHLNVRFREKQTLS